MEIIIIYIQKTSYKVYPLKKETYMCEAFSYKFSHLCESRISWITYDIHFTLSIISKFDIVKHANGTAVGRTHTNSKLARQIEFLRSCCNRVFGKRASSSSGRGGNRSSLSRKQIAGEIYAVTCRPRQSGLQFSRSALTKRRFSFKCRIEVAALRSLIALQAENNRRVYGGIVLVQYRIPAKSLSPRSPLAISFT